MSLARYERVRLIDHCLIETDARELVLVVTQTTFEEFCGGLWQKQQALYDCICAGVFAIFLEAPGLVARGARTTGRVAGCVDH